MLKSEQISKTHSSIHPFIHPFIHSAEKWKMKLFFLEGKKGDEWMKQKSSQFPDMFPQRVPNSTSLLSHVLSASVVLLSLV
jgi:hypothetical protein